MTKAIKSVLTVIAAVTLSLPSFSQETTQQQYKDRYVTLVKNLGTSGVGVETLLDRWISDYPDDPEPVEYKFIYYLAKCQNTQLVAKEGKTYVGEAPVLSLNDSLGNPVNYFQEAMFDDDEIFIGSAVGG